MLELAARPEDHFVEIKISHPDKEDREALTSVTPKIDKAAEASDHHLRVLIKLEDQTSLTELNPLWIQARHAIKHPEDIEKIALVGDVPAWMEIDKILSTCFDKASVKSFDDEHVDDAEYWVRH